jgi:3-isopropylmalate/(R)-2-methylmalate dehydratase small subunit
MPQVVRKLGDDVSTDAIYPGRYMATVLPSETPAYAFADDAPFSARLKAKAIAAGSVLVAGRNFGCGSSREQAASCLKGHELVIVARGFARIFLQNAINLGLRVVVCPDIEAVEEDELEIRSGTVTNCATGQSFAVTPLPAARAAIVEAGGLVAYTRLRLASQRELPTGGAAG